MTDVVFVAGAYLAALGTIVAYSAMLVRRLRSARSARAAIDRQIAAEMGAQTQPQVL